jgi:hypothetical protein
MLRRWRRRFILRSVACIWIYLVIVSWNEILLNRLIEGLDRSMWYGFLGGISLTKRPAGLSSSE